MARGPDKSSRRRLSADALRMRRAIEGRLFGAEHVAAPSRSRSGEELAREFLQLAHERHRAGDFAGAAEHARAALAKSDGVTQPTLDAIQNLLRELDKGC